MRGRRAYWSSTRILQYMCKTSCFMISELAETARFFSHNARILIILQGSVGQVSARSNLQQLCRVHARSCKTFLYGLLNFVCLPTQNPRAHDASLFVEAASSR